ncbi:MAG: penicillin-binding protein [Deltaproteobacteria bacterium]|nr:penicillin-binding protein [Deltaproteobacteria bacterium]
MRQGYALFAAVALVAASLPFLRKQDEVFHTLLSKAKLVVSNPKARAGAALVVDPPALTDLDLSSIDTRRDIATAPAHGKRTAELTIDPTFQEAADTLLQRGEMHTGAIILTEVATGKVLAWSSVSPGRRRDVCTEPVAPSASVFKIVTGSALVEHGVPLNEKYCYGGGEHSLSRRDLEPSEERDKWCATVGMAMGRSINAVFARLALKHVERDKLRAAAMRFGYAQDIPFDVLVKPSTLEIPEDELEYARMAAGFWHTTLSPFQGLNIALTVANHGEMVRQHVVERVLEEDGSVIYERPKERQVLKRALDARTAQAVGRMMEQTVRNGTSFQSFHDRSGRPYLPDVRVAGKTGTLTEKKTDSLYTWWVGYAPARQPEIALSVLVMNRGAWRVKATNVAADMLRVYFADRGVSSVRPPPGIRLRARSTGDAGATPTEPGDAKPADPGAEAKVAMPDEPDDGT